jgi:5-methylthioadenosine/S-adenosylhomocysteine deaminase
MSNTTLLIEGAYVLTLDDTDTSGFLTVVTQRDRIAAIDTPDGARLRFPDADRFDAAGTVMMPGLINAHLHPESQLLKGWVEGLGLHGWRRATHFNRALTLLGSDAGRTLQRTAVRAALADCLLSGATTVATYGMTVGADQVAADALEELGLNGHVTIRDIGFTPFSAVPAWTARPPRMYRLHAEEALTEAELAAAADAAARGERIVMHAAETRIRQRLARRMFGATTVRLLARFGLLSPRLLLSHAVHIDAEERALLVEHDVGIVASPAAEMKLADGVAPFVDLIRAGVPVAIGTDSALCNNGNDMLVEARMLGLSQSLRYGAGALSPAALLRCATVHGARVLGETDVRGRIVVGLAADLVLIDVRNPRLQPLLVGAPVDNVCANLVYAATGSDVRDVMVGGCWRVLRGALVDLDASALWAELADAGQTLARKLA